MRARLLLFALVAGAVALSGCTNDYDQFDFGSAGEGGTVHDGAIEADRSVTGGQAGQGGQGPGGQGGTAGDASLGGGGALPDGPSDVIAQEDAPPSRSDASDASDATNASDATDVTIAPDVADVRAEAEAGRDVSSEPDAGPPDVSLDAQPDISPDVAQERDAAADVQDASLDIASDVTDAPPCAPGSKLCGATCVPTNDPATGCAAVSCNPCVFPNATASCGDAGACAIGACNGGFADCDGVAANGCEVTLATNIENCGQCGRACSSLNTISRRCVAGACMPSCGLGFDSCMSPAAPAADDGCERSVRSNTSCGSCNNDCAALGTTPFSCLLAPSPPVCGCVDSTSCGGAAGTCSGTNQCVCGGTTCHFGETCLSVVVDAGTEGGPADIEAGADAGGDAESGSETDGDTDGGVEAAAEAGGGTIVVDFCACNGAAACAATQTCCPSGCRDLSIDVGNCGACGRACFNGFACVGGACQCNSNGDCNGGSTGTCAAATGRCTCSGISCMPGQRCQADGTCG